jgi:hypothetical protein
MARSARWCTAWPTSCWSACALERPERTAPLFGGKIAAQAYDNAAFKVAADELVLASGAQLLFHAQAVGVVMNSPSRSARC